jgi:hypothetical protein
LGIAVALPIVVLCFVVARVRSLREGFRRVPLWLLVGVHTVRLLGITFVIFYAANRLPAPFAPVAGWGDILSAQLLCRWRGSRIAGPQILDRSFGSGI